MFIIVSLTTWIFHLTCCGSRRALRVQTNDINETIIEDIAAGMVSSGLRAVGYRFVNMDAGVWAPERSLTGEIVPDATKFPSGMAALSAKIHGMGLKMGLVRLMSAASYPVRSSMLSAHPVSIHVMWQYTDLSNRTVGMVCGTGPGSYGHYESDTKTFAAAGADFLKVDYCAYDQTDTSKYNPPIRTQLSSWQQLRDALNATKRPIYSYFCPRSFGGSVVPPNQTRGDCGPPPKRCIDDGPPHQWDGPTRQALANTILTE
eukprot:COSAG02_NODE_8340_length_2608_cov_1.737744_1_plen_260_part_00